MLFRSTIAAGLHGIARKLEPPPMFEGSAYGDATVPRIPTTLREAIGELERGTAGGEAFGDKVVEHYLHTARLELEAQDKVVTCWELWRNFERI